MNLSNADMTNHLVQTALKQALFRVSEESRHIFVLKVLQGIPIPDVAEILCQSEHMIRRKWTKVQKEVHQQLSEIFETEVDLDTERLSVTPVIEQVKKLTPLLIEHLRENCTDLPKLPWDVFEHLIAEFFASWGYRDVCVVGRTADTAADVVAMRKEDSSGASVRVFVEVKRWRDRAGIEVVDRVAGAIMAERPQFGWHMGMVVSLHGFKQFKRTSKSTWKMLGIELRDGEDIQRWLMDYRQSSQGLWLPDPHDSSWLIK